MVNSNFFGTDDYRILKINPATFFRIPSYGKFMIIQWGCRSQGILLSAPNNKITVQLSNEFPPLAHYHFSRLESLLVSAL